MISDDAWVNAKQKLIQRFGTSLNLQVCINLIKDFESTNTKHKYKLDLDIFIRESKLEDFFGDDIETIFVSTIHKAKGREFDNVFLMLDQFNSSCMGEQLSKPKTNRGCMSEQLTASATSPGTNAAARQLYVAMTRAKRNLTIHYNGNFLDFIKTDEAIIIDDSKVYLPPFQLAMKLSYRDIWLDYFLSCQNLISQLNTGDVLTVDGECCMNSKGQPVLKFSKKLIKQIDAMKQKNYVPKLAKIRFIVYWQKENSEYEIRIVLPELYFERTDDLHVY
jgi:ATP-dependent DNA helicase RecQ